MYTTKDRITKYIAEKQMNMICGLIDAKKYDICFMID